jgi:hypothetical protein
LILREGSAFIDLCRVQDGETSIWRYACQSAFCFPTPKTLQLLIEAGVDVAEVDEYGYNCLFNCVLTAEHPHRSAEFGALRFLLTVSMISMLVIPTATAFSIMLWSKAGKQSR